VKTVSEGFDEDVIGTPELWDCLTCNTCTDRCQSDVDFAEFIRAVRSEAVNVGNVGICSHNGIMQGLMRFMTNPTLKPDKLFWLTDDLKTVKNGKTMLFTGCMPIYQTIFDDIGASSLDILRASIKLLNHAGVTPVMSNEERCCGHDMLWNGNVPAFEKLAQLNAEFFSKLGVETIITACPEGYFTLAKDYPEFLNNGSGSGKSDWDFEVIHITKYLADLVTSGELVIPDKIKLKNKVVTYHDPCRLGRFMGEYDAPRALLNAIPGLELREMEHNKNRSLCCGVSGWNNCTNTSRQIRAERLTEAKDTGADLLLTSCPKCQIHFKCYTTNKFMDPQIELEVEDLIVFFARAMGVMK
jgi:Fe-S oxidoreductase